MNLGIKWVFKMKGYGARIIKVHCKLSRNSCSGKTNVRIIFFGDSLPRDIWTDEMVYEMSESAREYFGKSIHQSNLKLERFLIKYKDKMCHYYLIIYMYTYIYWNAILFSLRMFLKWIKRMKYCAFLTGFKCLIYPTLNIFLSYIYIYIYVCVTGIGMCIQHLCIYTCPYACVCVCIIFFSLSPSLSVYIYIYIYIEKTQTGHMIIHFFPFCNVFLKQSKNTKKN